MRDNIIHKVSCKIKDTSADCDVYSIVNNALIELGNIYSYVIFENKEGATYWIINISVSQVDEYNTLPPSKVAKNVAKTISRRRNCKDFKNVVGYEQPPIDLMVVLFEPLVQKLVNEQKSRWQYLEREDLYQMCMLTMCKLHKLNYYLNPTLLRRAFNNEVLMHISKNKNAPILVSLYDRSNNNKEGDNILVGDTVPDLDAEIAILDFAEQDAKSKEQEDKRDVVIDLIGQRQYDQLLREYGNNMTTSWSQHTVFRLKEKLKKQGITSKMFSVHHEPNRRR